MPLAPVAGAGTVACMSTPTERPAPDEAGKARGNTLPVQGERQQRTPRMPHERDESVDSQESHEPSARRMGAIAHDDLAEGQVDTDKGPVLDAVYERQQKPE